MKTLHVLGLPNTITSKGSECPITQKIYKFCRIFENHPNYKVIHYGHNRSNVPAAQVNITSDEVLAAVSGLETDSGYYDLANQVFRKNAIREILARKAKGDFVMVFNYDAKGITDEINKDNDLVVMEPSVADDKAFSLFRCYESNSLKAAYLGYEGLSKQEPRWYWRVVPQYFDTSVYVPRIKENYIVLLSKNSPFCGMRQIIDFLKNTGMRIKLAFKCTPENLDFDEWPAYVEYVGEPSSQQRKDLIGGAFFGISLNLDLASSAADIVEMMLSDCVPITLDVGSATDYIVDGVNGFRCNTIGDILTASRHISNINRDRMKKFAQTNFSLNSAKKRYERIFTDFSDVLSGKGWFEEHSRGWLGGMDFDYSMLYD